MLPSLQFSGPRSAGPLSSGTVADAKNAPLVRFDLELLGGAFERRYRRIRPDVEALAWGSLDTTGLDGVTRRDAQTRWTLLAFNEYKTSSTMARVAHALIGAQAPVDLVAFASTFVTDELVHAELAGRMAMELGGAAELLFDPNELLPEFDPDASALLRAAELVIRVSSVSEVLSSAVVRGLWRATEEPLAHAVLGVIMRDEQKHAALGAAFLDWAEDALAQDERDRLASAAQSALDDHRAAGASATELSTHPANPLAWFSSNACRAIRDAAIRDHVVLPLRKRRIFVR